MNGKKEKHNKTKIFKQRLRNFAKHNGNVIIFLFIWLFAMIFVRNFATLENNINIIKQSAIPVITCLGMTLVLMIGGIDLSVGYLVGLGCYMSGMFVVIMDLPVGVAILLTLLIGLICGSANGILVQIVKIPPFIVTLGSGYIIYGLAQILSNGTALSSLPKNFLAVGRTNILGLPSSVWIGLVVVVIFYFLMHKTTYGRSLAAIGLNVKASYLSGINDKFIIISTYAISGMMAVLVGILLGLRVNNCTPIMGGGDHTFVTITAAILGGASLKGGKGTAIGAVLGVFTIIIIENIVNLSGVNYYIFKAVLSSVILAAIIFENYKNRILQ